VTQSISELHLQPVRESNKTTASSCSWHSTRSGHSTHVNMCPCYIRNGRKPFFKQSMHYNYKKLLLTWLSSCLRSVERASTHVGREGSCGSILVQSRETTAIAECRVSLCTRQPLSRMNDSTQFRPPASKTAPASRVQINSKTCQIGTHFSKLKQKYSLNTFNLFDITY
jgi:hypothetical protein